MSTARAAAPIGVFDSGVGGLSVMRAIRRLLPSVDLAYVADSGNAPYGDLPESRIVARTLEIGAWLERTGAQALTVACNTATAVAVTALRARATVPVIAIEPAIKPAVARTRSGVVGVIATTRTVGSARVARLCATHGGEARILLQACPGLAERVEAGDLDGFATRALLRGYVEPLLSAGADTLVLGCTHYPFLEPTLRAMFGSEIVLIDPAEAVARELVRRIGAQADPDGHPAGTVRILTSGELGRVRDAVASLWDEPIDVEALPEA